MIAISKLTFLYNYHPVLSAVPYLAALWRTRVCCASDTTTPPFSRQVTEYPVNLLLILGCETWNHTMRRSRVKKAVSLWPACGWRLHTNLTCKTWLMVSKTGIIKNIAHEEPKLRQPDGSCLWQTPFFLRKKWRKLLCLEADAWDSRMGVLSSMLVFCQSWTPHPHAAFCAWLFTFTVKGNGFCLPTSFFTEKHLSYLFLWFPSLILGWGPRYGYSADQELTEIVSGQWHPLLWLAEGSKKLFPGVKQMEIVQGAAQVAQLHGKLWRGPSGSRVSLSLGRFCSAKSVSRKG